MFYDDDTLVCCARLSSYLSTAGVGAAQKLLGDEARLWRHHHVRGVCPHGCQLHPFVSEASEGSVLFKVLGVTQEFLTAVYFCFKNFPYHS